MKLSAADTALLVIDVQVALFDPPPAEAEEVVARINGLAGRARAAGVPVILVQHERGEGALQRGTPGWQLVPGLETAPGDLPVHKRMSDAFLHTPLHELLAGRGVRQLVVAGFASEFCVDSTIRSAAARGYDVTIASDAHTTHDKPHATGLQIRTHENQTLPDITSFPGAIRAMPAAGIAFG